jgi:hypothetical protein
MEFLSTNGARNTFMNKYTTKFITLCPINKKQIVYQLEIKHSEQIMVEKILEEVGKYTSAFHERIADELFILFGGEQTLTANHHGVVIQTERKL